MLDNKILDDAVYEFELIAENEVILNIKDYEITMSSAAKYFTLDWNAKLLVGFQDVHRTISLFSGSMTQSTTEPIHNIKLQNAMIFGNIKKINE